MAPPGSPAQMFEYHRQQEMFAGMAKMHHRLQEERARHAGLATELRYFAKHLKVPHPDLVT